MANLTAAMALRLIAKAQFRPMDRYDRDSFSGVEAADALIHYADEADESYTIILDGHRICLIDSEGTEAQFELGDNIFDF